MLEKIFGPQALRVDVQAEGGIVTGKYQLQEIQPMGVTEERGVTVTEEHIVGHFLAPGPQTLPGYKMIQAGLEITHNGVVAVSNVRFTRIAVPNESLKIDLDEDGTVKIYTEENQAKICEYKLGFSTADEQSCSKLCPAVALEIAAQTSVAQYFHNHQLPDEPTLYPLILSVDEVRIYPEIPIDTAEIVTAQITQLRVNEQTPLEFVADVVILNREYKILASISEIKIRMGSQRQIDIARKMSSN